ncbi:thioesterase [Saccharopolyspora erythraea]|nr:thioesterase [Saccharopolyspora erythraea]
MDANLGLRSRGLAARGEAVRGRWRVANLGPEGQSWFRRFHTAPQGATRLVCFPHAGGSASSYLQLSKELSSSLEVFAVQYPGRQDRRGEPGFASMTALAERIAEVITPLLDRPFAFFGHSMGAIAAFEVARLLEARGGGTPRALFASGRRAPTTSRDESVHKRDDKGLIDEIRQLSGTDSRLFDDEEIVQMILPSLRSDYTAIETYEYRPGPDVSCPIVALAADADPRVTIEEAQQWKQHTADVFHLETFRGGHFYLNDQVPQVARTVTAHLGAAAGG